MRILINGYYGFGNFGDDLLLACTHRLVMQRYPQAQIAVFANYSQNLVDSVAPPLFRNYVHRIVGEDVDLVDWTHREHFDLIVHGGGGTFLDSTRGPMWRRMLNAGLIAAGAPAYAVMRMHLRRAVGRLPRITSSRRIGIGLGIGPYVSGAPRLAHEAETLGTFDRIAVRDPSSLSWCARLGLQEQARCFTDLVFATALWGPPACNTVSRRITFVICAGKQGNSALIAVARRLVEMGCPVRIVLLDPVHDESLLESLPSQFPEVVCWDPWTMKLDEFARMLGDSAVVISNRAHGLIVAAICGVPTICINTDDKLRSIQEMLPRSSRLFPVDEIETGLADAIENTILSIQLLKEAAEYDVANRQSEANAMIDYVLEL